MNQDQAEIATASLVSVIIPTFNCERYIASTLAAVFAQTHARVEVIVVDDGSTDRTPEIVASHKGVKLLQQANQRVCAARNRGFEASQGEFVCFLDHDDYWFSWKLQRQLETFAAFPEAAVVFTAFQLWNAIDGDYPDPSQFEASDDSPTALNAELSGWVYHQFLLDCWALTSTAMIRREALVASGGFDTTLPYSEDWDLWLRLSRKHPFVMLERVSTLYRQHASQGSRAVREVDYRTRILGDARRRWGLASPDGRGISAGAFDRNIARYHAQFGLQQLRFGTRRRAVQSFAAAWGAHPTKLRYAALLLAGLSGWRPST